MPDGVECVKEIMVIVNPASANGATRRKWPAIERQLAAAGLDYDWQFTTGPGDATVMARNALRSGARIIVSVGGDGTTNEVVNGFYLDGVPVNPDAEFGIIPGGTGGDLIRTLGIPKQPAEAIARLMSGAARTIDLGRMTVRQPGGAPVSRLFINVGGVGLDGDTVDRVNHTTKVFGGFVSFLWGVLAALAAYRNKPAAVTVDGQPVADGKAVVVVVANGRYFGGGMHIAPKAAIDDGLFDIVHVGDMGKLELIVNLPRLYAGTHLTHPKVSLFRGRHVAIRCPGAVVDCDGEVPGVADAEFELLQGALRIRA